MTSIGLPRINKAWSQTVVSAPQNKTNASVWLQPESGAGAGSPEPEPGADRQRGPGGRPNGSLPPAAGSAASTAAAADGHRKGNRR